MTIQMAVRPAIEIACCYMLVRICFQLVKFMCHCYDLQSVSVIHKKNKRVIFALQARMFYLRCAMMISKILELGMRFRIQSSLQILRKKRDHLKCIVSAIQTTIKSQQAENMLFGNCLCWNWLQPCLQQFSKEHLCLKSAYLTQDILCYALLRCRQ